MFKSLKTLFYLVRETTGFGALIRTKVAIVGFSWAGKKTMMTAGNEDGQFFGPCEALSENPMCPWQRYGNDQKEFMLWDVSHTSTENQEAEAWCGSGVALMIYVLDSSNGNTLEQQAKVLKEMLNKPYTQDAPVVVLLNKQDRQDAVCAEELVNEYGLRHEDLAADLKGRPCRLFPCSATTGAGLEIALKWAEEATERWAVEKHTLRQAAMSAVVSPAGLQLQDRAIGKQQGGQQEDPADLETQAGVQ